MISFQEFDKQINEVGYACLPGVVRWEVLHRLRQELNVSLATCRKVQILNGVAEDTSGSVHHLPAISPVFVEFLGENPAAQFIDRFFEGRNYILQSMGGNFNFPSDENYASHVHRDVRSFWNERAMLNTLVMLDELTKENGATWLMPGGHLLASQPTDRQFDALSIQVEAPAGSILMWDSRLWHKAGQNRTDRARRIITPIFSHPAMKQGFDYPRSVAFPHGGLSEYQRQVLGFNARVPATLAEWYRKPDDRFYKPGQG